MILPKLNKYLSDELTAYLAFLDLPLTSYEKVHILNNPNYDLMMASFTMLMKQLAPKDLPNHVSVRRTKFDGYDDAIIANDNDSKPSASGWSGLSITEIKQKMADFATKPKLTKRRNVPVPEPEEKSPVQE